jgi:hypothetical protein
MASDVAPGSLAELAALYPIGKAVTVAGRQFEIPAAGIRHGGEVMQRWLAISAAMVDGTDENIYADEHPEEFAELVTFALGCPRDQIDPLGPVEKVDLWFEWLRVNADFFLVRLPLARARQREAAAGMFGVGPTASTDSSGRDTTTPKTTPRAPPNSSSSPPKKPSTANASSMP